MLGIFGRKRVQNLDDVIGLALNSANEGRVKEAICYIKEARSLSEIKSLDFSRDFSQIEADFISKTAYKRGLDNAVNSAFYWAKEGDVTTSFNYINEAKHYASVLGIEVDEENIKALRKFAYERGIEENLIWAASWVESGSHISAIDHIKRAKKYAKKIELDISDLTQKLEIEVYSHMLKAMEEFSEETASNGHIKPTLEYLKRAKKYAKMLGIDITARADEIEKTAYARQAERYRTTAEGFEIGGHHYRATLWNSMAKRMEIESGRSPK